MGDEALSEVHLVLDGDIDNRTRQLASALEPLAAAPDNADLADCWARQLRRIGPRVVEPLTFVVANRWSGHRQLQSWARSIIVGFGSDAARRLVYVGLHPSVSMDWAWDTLLAVGAEAVGPLGEIIKEKRLENGPDLQVAIEAVRCIGGSDAAATLAWAIVPGGASITRAVYALVEVEGGIETLRHALESATDPKLAENLIRNFAYLIGQGNSTCWRALEPGLTHINAAVRVDAVKVCLAFARHGGLPLIAAAMMSGRDQGCGKAGVLQANQGWLQGLGVDLPVAFYAWGVRAGQAGDLRTAVLRLAEGQSDAGIATIAAALQRQPNRGARRLRLDSDEVRFFSELLRIIQDPEEYGRGTAARLLARIGRPAQPWVMDLVESPLPDVALAAAQVLYEMRCVDAIPAIQKRMPSRFDTRQREFREHLGWYADALQELMLLVKDLPRPASAGLGAVSDLPRVSEASDAWPYPLPSDRE